MSITLLHDLINNASGMHLTIKAWWLWQLHPFKGRLADCRAYTRRSCRAPKLGSTEAFRRRWEDIVAPLAHISHPC